MTDLREQIFAKALTDAEKVFLNYHQNSPWAQEKIKAGVHLFPESVAYMRRELSERARADAVRAKNLEGTEDEKQHAEAPAPGSAGERQPPADGMGGGSSDTA